MVFIGGLLRFTKKNRGKLSKRRRGKISGKKGKKKPKVDKRNLAPREKKSSGFFIVPYSIGGRIFTSNSN